MPTLPDRVKSLHSLLLAALKLLHMQRVYNFSCSPPPQEAPEVVRSACPPGTGRATVARPPAIAVVRPRLGRSAPDVCKYPWAIELPQPVRPAVEVFAEPLYPLSAMNDGTGGRSTDAPLFGTYLASYAY